MNDYSASIEFSSRNLTTQERVNLKLSSGQRALGTLAETEDVLIDVDFYAILKIHNEKSQDKDYINFVIGDTNGCLYNTGSESFITAFTTIVDTIKEENNGELIIPFSIRATAVPSKNRQGKTFLACLME